ncbi:MAG: hypothetical protein L6R40_002720, partial [Gallowayella cf. fulva]
IPIPIATISPIKLISAARIPALFAGVCDGDGAGGVTNGPPVDGVVPVSIDEVVGAVLAVLAELTTIPVIVVKVPSTFASKVVLRPAGAVVDVAFS